MEILRRRLLIAAVADVPDLPERLQRCNAILNLLSGIYEEVSRVAATHRRR
jgi:predicted MarR family transcription regulator